MKVYELMAALAACDAVDEVRLSCYATPEELISNPTERDSDGILIYFDIEDVEDGCITIRRIY